MAFTDHFIRRPVLALVVSSLLLLLGGTALSRVNLREFPELERSVINVFTIYQGASAPTVQGFVTAPLQLKIAGARGIEYMTSASNPSVSEIEVNVRLGENSSDVLSEVIAKVNEARGDLPRDIEDPVVTTTSGGDAMMYLAFRSKQMTPYQITDYLVRSVQPELAALEGVGNANIFGRYLAVKHFKGASFTPFKLSNQGDFIEEKATEIMLHHHCSVSVTDKLHEVHQVI